VKANPQMFVHVFSGYWNAYYRPNKRGYTEDRDKAGVYRFEEVCHLLGESYSDKKIELEPAAPEYEI